ncbi:MAG: protein translocase subunit SecF [Acidimicrobiales bacterium]
MPDGLIMLIVLAVVAVVLQIAAVVDIVRRPGEQFEATSQRKWLWLVISLVFAGVGAAVYLFAVRPRILRANDITLSPVFPPASPVPRPPSSRGIFGRLYHGETRVDVVGRARRWMLVSGLVILVGLVSLDFRGLHLGIDFEGGVVWEVPTAEVSVEDAREFMNSIGVSETKIQTLEAGGVVRLRIQAGERPQADVDRVRQELATRAGVPSSDITTSSVTASWGQEITEKAARALLYFLVAITLYVTLRFEFKMALATLAALLHDILVTVGVYSITGFEVTPATVIAILTILGFSIYDGIVVFDKVDENTRLVSSTNRIAYSDMINLSLNQTLMRSLNTQITSLLPMASLLIVGALILGATTLQEFALALLVGQAAGAYSSIFIASPMLALLKEREPRYRDVRRRISAREATSRGPIEPLPRDESPGEPVPVGAGVPTAPAPAVARPSGAIPPRPRKKGKRR